MPEAAPIPFRILLDEAAKISRRHVRTIYLPVAIRVAVLQGLLGALQVGWLSFNVVNLQDQQNVEQLLASAGALGCLTVVLAGLLYLAYTALWAVATDAVAGRQVDLKHRLRWIFRGRTFGTLLLVVLALLGAFLACIFPVIWVGLILSLVIPVMVEEDLAGPEALRRSSQLVRHNPQRNFLDAPIVKVFVLLVVGGLLQYALAMLFQLPVSILQQVMIFREAGAGGDPALGAVTSVMWLQVPAQFLAGFTTTAVQLYQAVGFALLYFDVRRRREGSDLEAALDELAGDGGGGPAP